MSDVKEIVENGRTFMHDVSNQLLIAQGNFGQVKKLVSRAEDVDPKILEKIEKGTNAINNIVEMFREHREYLISHDT